MTCGLSASTNPRARPFIGQHPGQVDEILDAAYSKAEAALRVIPRQAMITAANQLTARGFITGEELRAMMATLVRSAEAAPARPQLPDRP